MPMFKNPLRPNASTADDKWPSKKPFKDPIQPRQRKTHPSFDPKSEDTFRAPTKETATTGRYAAVGDDYGVGFRTPVGKFKAGSMESGPIPMKSIAVDPNEV